jgi:hypothetical protein
MKRTGVWSAIQTRADVWRAVRAGSADWNDECAAGVQQLQVEDSGRAGQVGPGLRISHAGREGALLASARQ